MSIKTKVVPIEIDGEKFYLSFTMSSMHEYKERYKRSAMQDLASMTNNTIDEEVLFQLFSVCLRREIGGDIVEREFLEELNPLAVITAFSNDIVEVCFSSLPTGGTQKKQIKK